MKRFLLILVFVSVLVLCSGCSKKCTCKAKFNGETFKEIEITPEAGHKCSDYDDKVEVMGMELDRKCASFSLDGII